MTLVHCFDFLSNAISAVVYYHNAENRPVNGICVANHTSPIDALVLMCDNCYSLVSLFTVFRRSTTSAALLRARLTFSFLFNQLLFAPASFLHALTLFYHTLTLCCLIFCSTFVFVISWFFCCMINVLRIEWMEIIIELIISNFRLVNVMEAFLVFSKGRWREHLLIFGLKGPSQRIVQQ